MICLDKMMQICETNSPASTMTIETTKTANDDNTSNRSNCKSPRPIIEIRILGVENTNYKIQRYVIFFI